MAKENQQVEALRRGGRDPSKVPPANPSWSHPAIPTSPAKTFQEKKHLFFKNKSQSIQTHQHSSGHKLAPQTGSWGANACRLGQGQQRNSSDTISSSHWTIDSWTDMSFCVHSSNHVPPPIPSLDMAHQRGICARIITCHTILYNLVIATSFSESSFYFNLNQISAKYFFAQNTYKSFLIWSKFC